MLNSLGKWVFSIIYTNVQISIFFIYVNISLAINNNLLVIS